MEAPKNASENSLKQANLLKDSVASEEPKQNAPISTVTSIQGL